MCAKDSHKNVINYQIHRESKNYENEQNKEHEKECETFFEPLLD